LAATSGVGSILEGAVTALRRKIGILIDAASQKMEPAASPLRKRQNSQSLFTYSVLQQQLRMVSANPSHDDGRGI
jgi:hypothetical protein